MKKIVLLTMLGLLGCKSNSHTQVVDRHYNFSVRLPEAPTVTTDINDEGLESKQWLVKHAHLSDADYYSVPATCYKEVLKADDELQPNPALLALNGITLAESRRFTMRARETNREIPALATTTKSGGSEIINNIYAVDGHCMLSVTTRVNPGTAGENALFLNSFQLLR